MSSLSQNMYPSNQNLNMSSNMDIRNPSERDLIAQLKSQIFDLEQNEKNYDALQTKYKSLSNDASILNEEKMRLEYELKQKTETSNKIISDLQTELENLQNTLNEKLATNKTLFNDNNNLFASLEARNSEVEQLKYALNERDEIIEKLTEEKHENEKAISILSDNKLKNENSIQKMNDDINN